MKPYKTGKALAILSLGIAFGLFRHYQQARILGLGRDGYLAEQSHYFDRITQLHSTVLTIVAGIIICAVGAGLYELIAAGITSALPASTLEE